jgi:energy-coupling factor transport system ATP-binding protein
MSSNLGIVEFRDFSFRYLGRSRPALRGINLRIEDGEVVGIIGPPGAGKTSLLQALNGLIPHVNPGFQQGDVVVAGLNTRDESVASLARFVGLVLQDPEVQLFNLTVWDEVAFGLINLGLPRKDIATRVAFALQETGLTEFAHRNPSDLSGGEQQAVAIASVIAMMPRVLALDEPVSMLDPVGKEQVLDIIRRITKSGNVACTIISDSGADIDDIVTYLDRLIVLNDGEIMLDGPPEAVLSSDVLDEVGVGRPQVTELFLNLRREGIEFGRIPVDLDTAASLLCERLRKSRIRQLHTPLRCVTNDDTLRESGEVISVRNVYHVYDAHDSGVIALRGVSLALSGRQMVGIIGQNGSGKTTLARHLVGLLKPTNRDARILVCGHNVVDKPLRDTIRIANYIFQNPDDQLFMESVYDEVAFAPRMFGASDTKLLGSMVAKYLEIFGLRDFMFEDPLRLPKHSRTFLAICSVLPLSPKVLIVDEPTTGLDRRSEDTLMQCLSQLLDDMDAILVITHNMKIVARYCGHVIVMCRGEILCEGGTSEILGRVDTLAEADIKPPHITRLGLRLVEFGLRKTVLTVEELTDLLTYNLAERYPV